MFREMLRANKQLSAEECIRILIQQPRGILSVLGDDGYPYGIPMDHWYCEADGKLYFHCGPAGHKLDALKNSNKVSFCVLDEGRQPGDWALTFHSVIVFGQVRIIDDPTAAIEITRQLSYKFTQDTAYIESEIRSYGKGVVCLQLTPEHITGKVVHEA